jgi:hypothetical protein
MATETIKVENGSLLVNRNAPGKSNLEVSLSDVEEISFERGGEANGASDGTLVLITKDKDRHTVRIADDEVGKYLKQIYEAQKPAPKAPVKASEK